MIEGVPAGGTSTVTLNMTATCSSTLPIRCTALGVYTVKVIGAVGTISRNANVAATVTSAIAGPDFTISATTPANFNIGATGSSTIMITPSGGFTGTVTLTAVVSPATGLVANCPPSLAVVSGAVTGTCAPSSTTPGVYLVTVTGTGGSQTHSASFVSHVGDFSITATNPSGAAGASV